MASIKGIINAKGKASSGGGGHANLRTYEASIVADQNEPNVYHLDLSQSYIVDLATGMTPTSYNAGDIVYACMPDGNSEDEIENIYVVNRVDNTTDLILQSKMPVRHQILTTSTDATYSNSEYTLAFINLDEMPNIKDYVAYVNNGALTTLYQVASIDWADEEVVLTKIADIGGGGSQLYQHNISKVDSYNKYQFSTVIVSDSPTPMNWSAFIDYLTTNHATMQTGLPISFIMYANSKLYVSNVGWADYSQLLQNYVLKFAYINTSGGTGNETFSTNDSDIFFIDTVITL